MNIRLERIGAGLQDVPQGGPLLEWKIEENVDGTFLSTDGTTYVDVELNPREKLPPRNVVALRSDCFFRQSNVMVEIGVYSSVDVPGSDRIIVELSKRGEPKKGSTSLNSFEAVKVTL